MRWFRTNSKFGGRLALFALAIQLVLSFGHIHLEDIYGNARAFAITSAAVTPPAADHSRSLPAGPHSHHADDYCAICATMHLLGSSLAAQAPRLPLPFISESISHFNRVAFIFLPSRRAPFQSRAPPQA